MRPTHRRLLLFAASTLTIFGAFAAWGAEPATAGGAMAAGTLGALLAGTGGPTLVELIKGMIPERWVPDGISPAGNVAITVALYLIGAWVTGGDPVEFATMGLAVAGASTGMVSTARVQRLMKARRAETDQVRAEFRRAVGHEPGSRKRQELLEEIEKAREEAP